MQDFNFYKINKTLDHKYYQMPQELFINPLLNYDSKLLYSFLLNRLSLIKYKSRYTFVKIVI